MKEDLWRFFVFVSACLITGLFAGHVLLCLVIGLALYVAWQYQTLRQLLSWIRRRKSTEPPDVPGLINTIAKEIDFLRMHHKKRKKKLSKFLQRFQESTAALPDAIVVLGEQGVIEWANDNAEKYLGIRWPEDARQRISNLIRHPDLVKYLKEETSSRQDRGLELVPQANPELRLELRVVPYGKTQQLLLARDITRIHRANMMRKDFIANASHELRTPLTVISGYLEALEEEATDDLNSWAQRLRQMRRQTDRMSRLVADLLKLSSLETDTIVTDLEIVNVPELLASVCDEALSISAKNSHKFSIDADVDLRLRANRGELYSAVSNLVFNAVQHTPEQGLIQVRWVAVPGGASLEVIDSGEGIAPEHVPRLTERFYRIDKGRSRDKGGTGLGLAIVKHVLRRLDATLEIDSKPGQGSTFRCRFPRVVVVGKDEQNMLTKIA